MERILAKNLVSAKHVEASPARWLGLVASDRHEHIATFDSSEAVAKWMAGVCAQGAACTGLCSGVWDLDTGAGYAAKVTVSVSFDRSNEKDEEGGYA
jgi:hypothetical protein